MIFDEAKALAYDPFAGDIGDSSDRTLRDAIVTARRSGECFMCKGQVQPGTRVRSRTDVIDGRIMAARWCADCSAAMAAMHDYSGSDDDHDEHGRDAVERREALRKGRQSADEYVTRGEIAALTRREIARLLARAWGETAGIHGGQLAYSAERLAELAELIAELNLRFSSATV